MYIYSWNYLIYLTTDILTTIKTQWPLTNSIKMSRKVDAPKYFKCSLIHIWHNSVRHDLFQCLEFSACTILIAIQQILLYEIIVSYCMHTLCLPYIPVRNTCTKLAKKCRFTKYILLNDYHSKFLFQFCRFLLINKETNCCLCSINPTFNGGHPGKKLRLSGQTYTAHIFLYFI